jgi:peptide/nickel transport system permease protein
MSVGGRGGADAGVPQLDVSGTLEQNIVEDPALLAPVAPGRSERAQARRERIGLLLRSPTFLIGAAIVVFWVFAALFGERLVPHDVYATNATAQFQEPNSEYWFGTDRLGRDVFSRVIAGARDILIVAPAATLLGTILGAIVGLCTGYLRGWFDLIVSRFVDALISLPTILMAMVVITALGPSTRTTILVVGLIFMPVIARTVRAAVLVEHELDYVQAARLRNERAPYIMFREILPNVMPPIVVEFTVRLGYAIFTVASLSFLGFGIQPPSPDWGLAISENYGLLNAGVWWPVLFPSLAIFSLIIAVMLIADGVTGAVEA